MSETGTTPLAGRLKQRIANDGPITIADYMAQCLADPEHGYYMSAEPFGASGDFITAPEVSQMFGELIGAWLLHVWTALKSPPGVHLVELGPGRGTLSRDILRVTGLRPGFREALTLHLVETSERLRAVQAETLADSGLTPVWHDSLDSLPQDGPLLVVANEFFDALPIHQYVNTGKAWCERCVGLDEAGELAFVTGPGQLDIRPLAADLRGAPLGAIIETQPLSNALAETLATRIARQDGAALVIDYGTTRTAPGDTLQAVRRHAYDPVLAHPGTADLTAHVNFEALARAMRVTPLVPRGAITQADFLLRLGLLERAGRLGAGKSPDTQERIRGEVERLAGPEEMGNLFKVLAVARADISLPAFDT